MKGNNISISIGISTAPQDGDCYMDLYKRADQALYQAKRSGKARVCNYFS
ncbi:MAG TPA: diguanylate cyclase [Anaerostipes hadrus]|nr:diguanylate cyclase [Anaerostipes hadrus]